VPQTAVSASSSFRPGWKWRLEVDALPFQMRPGAPELLVEPPEGGSAVPRDEAGGVEARQRIPTRLLEGESNERLQAAREDPAALQRVLVVQGDL
jgi:hypothetical protein